MRTMPKHAGLHADPRQLVVAGLAVARGAADRRRPTVVVGDVVVQGPQQRHRLGASHHAPAHIAIVVRPEFLVDPPEVVTAVEIVGQVVRQNRLEERPCRAERHDREGLGKTVAVAGLFAIAGGPSLELQNELHVPPANAGQHIL